MNPGPLYMTDLFLHHIDEESPQRCSFLPDLVLEDGIRAQDIQAGMRLFGGKVLKVVSPENKDQEIS